MREFKVGDWVKVLNNTNGGCHPIGYVDIITEMGERDCRVGSGAVNWYLFKDLKLEGKMRKYDELKERIEVLENGWDKEADDILQEISESCDESYFIDIKITHSGGMCITDTHYKQVEGTDFRVFSTQCEKNREFKKLMLELLDLSNTSKKSNTEVKIDKLQEQIDKLREEL